MTYAQFGTDLEKIKALESVSRPINSDKITLCALMMRYGHDEDISRRLCNIAVDWDHSPNTLLNECREIWVSGYRPDQVHHDIGSSNDTDSDS